LGEDETSLLVKRILHQRKMGKQGKIEGQIVRWLYRGFHDLNVQVEVPINEGGVGECSG